MPLNIDAIEREAYERGKRDALLDCVREIARITGDMRMGDFNDSTWKMVCDINGLLLKWAAEAAEASDYAAP